MVLVVAIWLTDPGVLGDWEDCLLCCDLSVSYFTISVLPGPRVLSWPREH